ncbi:MAG: DUF998 domain-containing protein [Candidatus Bilamarchaeaceae archaeon]
MKERVAGSLLIFASLQLFFSIIVSEGMYEGYHTNNNMISDLGVGKTAIIFNTAMVLQGLCAAIAAYYILQIFKQKIIFYTMLLSSIGAIIVGIFPETIIAPHAAGAFLVFFFGGIAAILSQKFFPSTTPVFTTLGAISILFFLLFSLAWFNGLKSGVLERMIAYPLIFWEFGAGIILLYNRENAKNK